MSECVDCGRWACVRFALKSLLCLPCWYRRRKPRFIEPEEMPAPVRQPKPTPMPVIVQAPPVAPCGEEKRERRYHTQYATWDELVAAAIAEPSEPIDAQRRPS